MQNISLDDMRLFVAVVQSGSLTTASELTGVPISRLSRRVTALEKALGTQLLNRGKKGVSLHELGESFYMHAQTMLSYAELAIGSVNHGLEQPKGVLKISLPTDMAGLIQDKLPEYLALHPQVQIELHLTQQKINMIQDGIDVAIRAGTINNDNVVAKTLFTLQFGIYAHKDYLAQYGTPSTPDDLQQHKIITQSLAVPWQFSQAERFISFSPNALIAANDFVLVKHFAEQGLGIAMLPDIIATDSQMVKILSDWHLPSTPLSVIYYKNRGAVPTVKSFVEWVLQTVPIQPIHQNRAICIS